MPTAGEAERRPAQQPLPAAGEPGMVAPPAERGTREEAPAAEPGE